MTSKQYLALQISFLGKRFAQLLFLFSGSLGGGTHTCVCLFSKEPFYNSKMLCFVRLWRNFSLCHCIPNLLKKHFEIKATPNEFTQQKSWVKISTSSFLRLWKWYEFETFTNELPWQVKFNDKIVPWSVHRHRLWNNAHGVFNRHHLSRSIAVSSFHFIPFLNPKS